MNELKFRLGDKKKKIIRNADIIAQIKILNKTFSLLFDWFEALFVVVFVD